MHSNNVARLVTPCDLIGAGEAAALLKISKPTLTRRIAAGTLRPLAQLEGGKGAFIFDRNDIQALVPQREAVA
jgi:hypothetical protein